VEAALATRTSLVRVHHGSTPPLPDRPLSLTVLTKASANMATTMARSPGTILTPRVAARSTLYSVPAVLPVLTLPLAPVLRLPRLAQQLLLAPRRPRRLLLLSRVLPDAQHPGQLNSPAPGQLLVQHGPPIAALRALGAAAPGLPMLHGETTRSVTYLYARMVLRQPQELREVVLAARTPCLKTGVLALLAVLVKPCSSHTVRWLPWLSSACSPSAAS